VQDRRVGPGYYDGLIESRIYALSIGTNKINDFGLDDLEQPK